MTWRIADGYRKLRYYARDIMESGIGALLGIQVGEPVENAPPAIKKNRNNLDTRRDLHANRAIRSVDSRLSALP